MGLLDFQTGKIIIGTVYIKSADLCFELHILLMKRQKSLKIFHFRFRNNISRPCFIRNCRRIPVHTAHPFAGIHIFHGRNRRYSYLSIGQNRHHIGIFKCRIGNWKIIFFQKTNHLVGFALRRFLRFQHGNINMKQTLYCQYCNNDADAQTQSILQSFALFDSPAKQNCHECHRIGEQKTVSFRAFYGRKGHNQCRYNRRTEQNKPPPLLCFERFFSAHPIQNINKPEDCGQEKQQRAYPLIEESAFVDEEIWNELKALFYETLYAAPSLTFEEIFGDFVDPYINIEEWDW